MNNSVDEAKDIGTAAEDRETEQGQKLISGSAAILPLVVLTERGETDVRTCLSCAICELSAVKTCCGSGFCDSHYAKHTEIAARIHHGVASELLRVARMALQQLEFTYGKQKRGWDAAFLMDELRAAITNAETEAEQREAIECLSINNDPNHGQAS